MAQHPLLFPWGSDEEVERQRSRSRSPVKGLGFEASSCSEPPQAKHDSCVSWKLPNRSLLAGRVLEYCQKLISQLRLEAGGGGVGDLQDRHHTRLFITVRAVQRKGVGPDDSHVHK